MTAKLAKRILSVALITIASPLGRAETAAGSNIQNLRFYAGISYTGTAGVAYELQYSTNLQDPGGWITVTNVVLDTNRLFFVDLDSPLSAKRFYRLHEVVATIPSTSSQPKTQTFPQARAASDSRQSILSAGVLATDWGPVIDPDHDCKWSMTNGAISVEVPGTAHDFAAELERWNAPRILTDIEGNFILEVRVGGEFRPGEASTIGGRRPYHGAGLLLVQDSNNHLSLQRGAVLLNNRIRHYANFELRHGPPAQVSNYEFEIEDKDILLRLARSGNKVLAMTSQDGINWRAFDPLTVDFPSALKVGVEVINSSQTPFACSFKGLALFRAVANQDVSGKWSWSVGGGKYRGKMELSQVAGGKITGRMYETSGGNGGTIEGTVVGNVMQFTRAWASYKQEYSLAVGPGAQVLTGTLSGERDPTVGDDFTASRE